MTAIEPRGWGDLGCEKHRSSWCDCILVAIQEGLDVPDGGLGGLHDSHVVGFPLIADRKVGRYLGAHVTISPRKDGVCLVGWNTNGGASHQLGLGASHQLGLITEFEGRLVLRGMLIAKLREVQKAGGRTVGGRELNICYSTDHNSELSHKYEAEHPLGYLASVYTLAMHGACWRCYLGAADPVGRPPDDHYIVTRNKQGQPTAMAPRSGPALPKRRTPPSGTRAREKAKQHIKLSADDEKKAQRELASSQFLGEDFGLD